MSVESTASQTDRLADPNRGVVKKVLCSDSKRFSEEFAAAGKSSEKALIKKYKLLVHERAKAGDYLAHCTLPTHLFCSSRMQFLSWRESQKK
jgi:hypothetical protein